MKSIRNSRFLTISSDIHTAEGDSMMDCLDKVYRLQAACTNVMPLKVCKYETINATKHPTDKKWITTALLIKTNKPILIDAFDNTP